MQGAEKERDVSSPTEVAPAIETEEHSLPSRRRKSKFHPPNLSGHGVSVSRSMRGSGCSTLNSVSGPVDPGHSYMSFES
ncbi:hypothetical protein AAFF_G00171400 [Aldrovandia affinis]|uniref:Uncharacterized protein n=1 Tax=Aldrovandia affinis TaxID=143900 RepID=A0AAD7WWS6_9TELE|nr:hypothetical protein AAFF_G00171400 [Aldrovandia affinis]